MIWRSDVWSRCNSRRCEIGWNESDSALLEQVVPRGRLSSRRWHQGIISDGRWPVRTPVAFLRAQRLLLAQGDYDATFVQATTDAGLSHQAGLPAGIHNARSDGDGRHTLASLQGTCSHSFHLAGPVGLGGGLNACAAGLHGSRRGRTGGLERFGEVLENHRVPSQDAKGRDNPNGKLDLAFALFVDREENQG